MCAVTCFTQFKNGTASHHFTAVAHESNQNVFQVKQLRLPLRQSHHIDTESHLQLRQRVEVVQHHFPDSITFDFNHDTHAVFIRLITQRTDTFYAFFFHQLGDFFNQPRLVHLIRDLVNNNGFATGFSVSLNFSTGTDIHLATASTISFFNTTATIDNRSSGEIWPRDVLHQPFNGDVFIFDIGQTAINNLRKVMRRNIGCHPDGNT
ncbi:Uncharacterised protein [Yersinia enterocolitica]|nr:Uncharacterised protein [Yersinia enterocolitica]